MNYRDGFNISGYIKLKSYKSQLQVIRQRLELKFFDGRLKWGRGEEKKNPTIALYYVIKYNYLFWFITVVPFKIDLIMMI